MFHDEYCKPIYFEVKRSKAKGHASQKNIAGVGYRTIMSAGFF